MKVRFSILAAASGSFGGVVASHNRGGPYLRARVVPTNPSSSAQVEIRTIFGNLASAWQTLTQDQRDAWTTYAINVPVTDSMGDPLTLTGQQMYVRCNTARVQAGLARVDPGPTVFALDSLSPVKIDPTAAADLYSVVFEATDDWVAEDDAGLLIFGSRELADTINFFKGPYRNQGIIAGDVTTPPTSPDVSITSVFALTEGNVIFNRAVSVRADGRISAVQLLGPNVILA